MATLDPLLAQVRRAQAVQPDQISDRLRGGGRPRHRSEARDGDVGEREGQEGGGGEGAMKGACE